MAAAVAQKKRGMAQDCGDTELARVKQEPVGIAGGNALREQVARAGSTAALFLGG